MRFARDRWYSNEGQRRLQQQARSESMGTRRIISLTLLLLLILVVMQQLNDPGKYKPAFEAIGLTQSTRPSNSLGTNAATPPDANSSSASEKSNLLEPLKDVSATVDSSDIILEASRSLSISPRSPEADLYMQMWLRLLEPASPEAIDELAQTELSHSLAVTARTDEQNSPTVEMPATVREWFDQTQTRIDKWQREYRSMMEGHSEETGVAQTDLKLGMQFVTQWLSWASLYRNGISLASSSLDQEVRLGLQLAIDRRMLGMIQDSSPWRPQERPVLARTLQRATKIANAFDTHEAFQRQTLESTPKIEINSLTKQSDEYRGQLVRIIGNHVTNPIPTTQVVRGWGEFEYDVVWIRPVDGSQQPICIYSLRQPENGWPTIASSPVSESSAEGKPLVGKPLDSDAEDTPLVEISGILLKRLAYPSQRGIDVAPVLIASSVRWLPDTPLDQMDFSPRKTSKFRSRRWIEPGEQAENLQLLQDIFAKDLESLLSPMLQSKLTDANLPGSIEQEVPPLGRILYQLPRVSKPLAAAIATSKQIGPAQLGSFQGRVQSVKPLQIHEKASSSGEAASVFRLQIEPHSDIDRASANEPITHIAFVNRVPNLWNAKKEVSQPVSLSGFFLDTKTDEGTTRCWFADHPDWSWRWQDESSQLSETFLPTLTDDWMHLGATGFDLSHIDFVRNLRGKSITSQESQAFYSLIDCSDRLSNADTRFADPALSAIDCLRDKDPPYLRRVRAKVNIVRATRILVTDEHDQAALDGESYYELDGLANLGDLSIQLKSADGKEKVLFDGEFPMTLIAKQLPGWLAPSSEESNEALATWYPRTTVQIEGIFYRLWSFSTAQTSALGRSNSQTGSEETRLKQIGPLVAVTQWEKTSDEMPTVTDRSIIRDLMIAVGFSAIGIYALFRWNQPTKRRKA